MSNYQEIRNRINALSADEKRHLRSELVAFVHSTDKLNRQMKQGMMAGLFAHLFSDSNASDYLEILHQIEALTLDEKLQLLKELEILIHPPAEVEGSDEVVPPEEIAESEAAWQDYQAGRDPGISSAELKKLLGGKLG